ncbi:SDR family oxidoreductase [Paenibacillus sp. BR2-3]|uniref:SDR family oxidoreductase n=1 Tax=Paenibacillus sp. BR2-3 TaxID=3048494 RepID=UPI0039772FFB
MKLLILGGNGMAGHMLVDYFTRQGRFTVFYTTRNAYDPKGLVVDVTDMHAVGKLIEMVRPQVIINAVGVLNQFAAADIINAYHVNGLLPHMLRKKADEVSARLVHISTDCVFEGTKGGYKEDDPTDGTSVYALSKALGEVREEGHITIRTSIIGPEIRKDGIGLMHWFFRQRGVVPGYLNVRWNGVTTLELAKAVDYLLESPLSGLFHLVHPESVSKYDLLKLIGDIWKKRDMELIPVEEPVSDRTLVSTRQDLDYQVPDYHIMLEEMYAWTNHV